MWCLLGMLVTVVLFVTHRFVQLQVCTAVTDCGGVVDGWGVLGASLCLCHIPHHPTSARSASCVPTLEASVIIPGSYFSTLHHYGIVINSSFYIEQLLVTAIYIKLCLYYTKINTVKTNYPSPPAQLEKNAVTAKLSKA